MGNLLTDIAKDLVGDSAIGKIAESVCRNAADLVDRRE